MILINLGESYVQLRRYAEGEDRLRRAVAILEKESGPPTAETAAAYNALAGLAQLTEDYGKSEASFRKCVQILATRLGPDHPETSVAIENLACSLAAQGRWDEVGDQLDRSRRSRRAFLDRTLPAMPEEDQYRFIEEGEHSSRDAALSMAVAQRGRPSLVARSAEWVLNSKALALRALAQRSLLSRDATNPEAAEIIAELDRVRGKLARMMMARDVPNSTTPGDEYRSLIERDRQLGLALKIPGTIDPWTGLDAVREALPDDAVLVEFARSRMIGNAKVAGRLGWYLPQYVAWVIPPKGQGEVELVDLGLAQEIEAALAEVLQGIGVPPPRQETELEAERKLEGPLRLLSDRLIKPLEAHLGRARRWILSPDANLWLVPWAALPMEDVRYAVERHLIHLVVSGRDLCQNSAVAKANPPAILADPELRPWRRPGRREVRRTQAHRGGNADLARHGHAAVEITRRRVRPAPRYCRRSQGDRSFVGGVRRRRAGGVLALGRLRDRHEITPIPEGAGPQHARILPRGARPCCEGPAAQQSPTPQQPTPQERVDSRRLQPSRVDR